MPRAKVRRRKGEGRIVWTARLALFYKKELCQRMTQLSIGTASRVVNSQRIGQRQGLFLPEVRVREYGTD